MPDTVSSGFDGRWTASEHDLDLSQLVFFPQPVAERMATKDELARIRYELEEIAAKTSTKGPRHSRAGAPAASTLQRAAARRSIGSRVAQGLSPTFVLAGSTSPFRAGSAAKSVTLMVPCPPAYRRARMARHHGTAHGEAGEAAALLPSSGARLNFAQWSQPADEAEGAADLRSDLSDGTIDLLWIGFADLSK
jgi:hypothetical protein